MARPATAACPRSTPGSPIRACGSTWRALPARGAAAPDHRDRRGPVAAHDRDAGACGGQGPLVRQRGGLEFPAARIRGRAAAALGLRVDLPDPTQSAAGLASLVEMSRLLGSGPAARTRLTNFAFSAQSSTQFSDPASLAAFSVQALPPLSARPVTVTSEQAVLAYDAAHPHQPPGRSVPVRLRGHARYRGTRTTPSCSPRPPRPSSRRPRHFDAALRQQLRRLRGPLLRVPVGGRRRERHAASDGLEESAPEACLGARASEAQTILQAWGKLQLGSRVSLVDRLLGIDGRAVRSGHPDAGAGDWPDERDLGLSLFPDNTQIGLWEIADNISGNLPYQQLVPVGPLPGRAGPDHPAPAAPCRSTSPCSRWPAQPLRAERRHPGRLQADDRRLPAALLERAHHPHRGRGQCTGRHVHRCAGGQLTKLFNSPSAAFRS